MAGNPLAGLLLLLAATAGWFMDTYGVVLDKEMLRNVFQTNFTEARDFEEFASSVRDVGQSFATDLRAIARLARGLERRARERRRATAAGTTSSARSS